jgi:hypothetical protein
MFIGRVTVEEILQRESQKDIAHGGFCGYLRRMRTCNVCCHPKKAQIEDGLIREESCASIAKRIGGVSGWSVGRHAQHMHRDINIQSANAGKPLIDRIENVLARIEAIATAATKSKHWTAAVYALREVRACLELVGKMRGEIVPVSQQIRVGVALNVNTAPPVRDLGPHDLELKIALDVAEATDNFDPDAIARMQHLIRLRRPRELPLTATNSCTVADGEQSN